MKLKNRKIMKKIKEFQRWFLKNTKKNLITSSQTNWRQSQRNTEIDIEHQLPIAEIEEESLLLIQ